jgi:hypothetical protein
MMRFVVENWNITLRFISKVRNSEAAFWPTETSEWQIFSSVSQIMVHYRLRAGRSGFDSRLGLGIFLFTTASRTALRPTQHPIQWVRGALSLGV